MNTSHTHSLSISQLNQLEDDAFCQHLAEVYEHSPWLVEGITFLRPFVSLETLHAALAGALFASDFPEQQKLIKAHPDLATKLEALPTLTDFSQAEQKQAGFASLDADTLGQLREKLRTYQVKYNHPFILCVTDYPATNVLPLLNVRIRNTYQGEHLASLFQVTRIAYHRLKKLIHENPTTTL